MNRRFKCRPVLFVAALATIAVAVQAFGAQPEVVGVDEHALELGRKVIAVREAIRDPSAPGAMDAVADLGLDSRYYVLTRGWLSMQLEGDRSIANAQGQDVSTNIQERIEFLQRAIRAIDLE